MVAFGGQVGIGRHITYDLHRAWCILNMKQNGTCNKTKLACLLSVPLIRQNHRAQNRLFCFVLFMHQLLPVVENLMFLCKGCRTICSSLFPKSKILITILSEQESSRFYREDEVLILELSVGVLFSSYEKHIAECNHSTFFTLCSFCIYYRYCTRVCGLIMTN